LIERSDITEQRDKNDMIEPDDSAEPMLPIESTEPTLPIESTEPRDPMLSSESCDQSDHLEPDWETAMAPMLPCRTQVLTAARPEWLRRPFCSGNAAAGSGHMASSSPMSSAISGMRGFVRRLGSAYAALASSGIAAM
jgi:hypothetical protein